MICEELSQNLSQVRNSTSPLAVYLLSLSFILEVCEQAAYKQCHNLNMTMILNIHIHVYIYIYKPMLTYYQ